MKKALIMFTTVLLGYIWATIAQSIPSDGSVRTITSTWALMVQSNCDPYWTYAFYNWSDVYFLLYSEQLKANDYWIFDDSFAWTYGNIFSGSLRIPYNSNIQPKLGTQNTPTNKIIITNAVWAKYNIPNWHSIPRNQLAWQIVTKNDYRLLRTTNPMRSYFFTNFENQKYTIQASSNFSPNVNWKTACAWYYVWYCGDWVVDKTDWDFATDGQWWIVTQQDGFKRWHATSIKPNEICDDWAQNGQPGKCKTDCSGIWWEWWNLVVTKTLTVEQSYSPGQNLQFRINFSNPTSQTIQNVTIEDFLPSWFEYISSQIVWWTAPIYFSTWMVQWNLRIAYTWFSLAGWQSGYILIDAKLVSCAAALNNVYWSAVSNWLTITGYTNKQVLCSTNPVNIIKTWTPSNIQLWQTVQYNITVQNTTQSTMNNIFIQDVWPTNWCLYMLWQAQTSVPATQTQAWNMTQWAIAGGLAPGQSISISFVWQSKTDLNCVGTHRNTWRVIYSDGTPWEKEAQTTADVTITQPAHQLQITKTVLWSGYAGPGDEVVFLIEYKNIWNSTINWYRIIDRRPNSLEFRSSTLVSTNQNIRPVNPNLNPLVWDFSTKVLLPGMWDSIRVVWRVKQNLR